MKRIQHHQISFTKNDMETSLGGKHKGGGRATKTNSKQFLKRVIGTYISIITLNVNGLNALTKNQRLDKCIQNNTHIYAAFKRSTSDLWTCED